MNDKIFKLYSPARGKIYSVDEALDLIGQGRFQYYAFLCCGLCLMYTLSETLGIGYVIATGKCDLELDTFRKGILSSVCVFGIVLSLHLSGFLTDQYGRKRTIYASVALSTTFSVISALVPGFWPLVVFRLLCGMSLAACASGTFAYMSEFFPVQKRAAAIMYGSSLGAVVSIFMPIFGFLNNLYQYEIRFGDFYTLYGWRIQLLSHLSPGLLALILLRNLPESPKYLMAVNEPEKCLDVLQEMYERNTGKARHQCPVRYLSSPHEDEERSEREPKDNKSLKHFFASILHETALLFKPPNLKLMLSCCFIQFGCFMIAGGFGLWFPELVNRISGGGQQGEVGFCQLMDSTGSVAVNASNILLEDQQCQVTVHEEMYINNIYLGSAHTFGFLLLALSLNKISLKTTMSSMLFMGCFFGLIMQHITNGALLVVVFCMFVTTCGVSLSLVNATVVHLFETNLRAMAISLSILVGRMGTVVGANAIGFLLDLNCSYTFYGMGLLALACALFSVSLPRK